MADPRREYRVGSTYSRSTASRDMWRSGPPRSGPTTSKTAFPSLVGWHNGSMIGAFHSQPSSHTHTHLHCALRPNQHARSPRFPPLQSIPGCPAFLGDRCESSTNPSNHNSLDANRPKLCAPAHIPLHFNSNHQFCHTFTLQFAPKTPSCPHSPPLQPPAPAPAHARSCPSPSRNSIGSHRWRDSSKMSSWSPTPTRSQISCTFSNT